MRKVSKENEEKVKALYEQMQTIKSKHDSLVNNLNEKIQSQVSSFNAENEKLLEELKDTYIDSADALKQLSSDQHKEMEAYIAERSDKWHDGEAGFNYRYWSEEWEEFETEMGEAACFDFDIEVELKRLPEPSLPNFKP